MTGARIGNKFLADTEPWKLIKTDPEAVKEIMHTALLLVEHSAKALAPILPKTSAKLNAMLSIKDGEKLDPGSIIGPAVHLFKKVEDTEIDAQKSKLSKPAEALESDSLKGKPMITFDDFTKLDIQVGRITAAEKVEGADKLLKLSVDMGLEERCIVSGIAEHYNPEEVLGKQVSVLVNLAPRKIRGVESQGMILMAEDAEGNLAFVSPEKEIAAGSTVR